MKLPGLLRSLRHRNYRLFFTGQSFSLVGTWMQRMAVSWLVYRLTHSAAMLGLVAFAGQFPSFLLSPLGGIVSDRYQRFKILLTTQIASLVQASVLAALVLSKHINIAEIIALSMMLGIINAFDTPSRQSLVIEMVTDKADLSNAIALNSSMVNVARLLGPSIAGILLASVGEGICFLLNAVSFLAVITSLLLMQIVPRTLTPPTQNVFLEFREGFRFLVRTPALLRVIVMLAAVSLVAMPYSTLLPIFARDIYHGDATTFGWLNSMAGLGALAGAFYLASRKTSKYLHQVIAITSLAFAAGLLCFGWSSRLGFALGFIPLCGFGMMSQIAASNTLIQTSVPDYLRGRMLSFYIMAFQGMMPVGSYLVGILAHRIGAPATLRWEGGSCLAISLIYIYYLRRQRLERTASMEKVAVG
ncbi:MAG TPA: MFS transporter [Chitinophagaceae bacterium]|nr:MFS transporter [Chitinophagaceae bacterium]